MDFDESIVGKDTQWLVVVNPRERPDFIVELGESGEMEIAEVAFCEEVARDLKWLRWGEAFDAGFLVRVLADGAIELAISAIGGVKQLEWDELGWVGR